MNINSERLIIRNLQSSDLDDFLFYRSNPEVTKYQSFEPMTLDRATNFIQSQQNKPFGRPGEWVQYAIENRETKKLIGDCAIKLDENDIRIAEVGITISHTQQNKGYAKETFKAIQNFLFSIDNFHRIVEIVDVENIASIKLLESLGFRKEGHFVENIYFKGNWGSEFQYALLKKDWEKQSNNH